MLVYVLRCMLWVVLMIFVVIIVCYLLLYFMFGGLFDMEKQLFVVMFVNLNVKYYFDELLWKQYLLYFGLLLYGDFGLLFCYVDWLVNDFVKKVLLVSFGVGGVLILVLIVFGVLFGIVVVVCCDSVIDCFVMLIGNFGNVVLLFVFGLVFVWIFVILLKMLVGNGWLLVGGWGDGGW